jgi:hypothetical protein
LQKPHFLYGITIVQQKYYKSNTFFFRFSKNSFFACFEELVQKWYKYDTLFFVFCVWKKGGKERSLPNPLWRAGMIVLFYEITERVDSGQKHAGMTKCFFIFS